MSIKSNEFVEQVGKGIEPENTTIPELVARQAGATPHALALMVNGQALNYGELNRRANQLAHYLRTLGVKPGVLVGLCIERSIDLVVGLLSILKAGGAYVPLDPTYPSERLTYMLEDAQVAVLVTRQRLAEGLAIQNTPCVCLDTDASLLEQQSEDDPPLAIVRDDLVYVIYTSGSTGRPKGVQIMHSNLLNLVRWHQCAFDVTPVDRATQLTSPAFDATGWELWPYLTAGASVFLPDEETRASPPLLRDWLLAQHITITFLSTALAESIIALEWPAATALRFLLTGADTLHHYPSPALPFTLVNNYGPTEATVLVTSGPVLPAAHPAGPPSIGRPIINTQIHLLDEHLQPVPAGEIGEIYIGGAGVAKGYLNRPELTAERFIHDPFSEKPEARLYKTGDLARYLPDGQLAFLGRSDYQIKIRGYRIEPNEIMTLLNAHPAIQTSQVVAREDTPGDKRLVAYLVLMPGAEVTAEELHLALETRLPDYMIPTPFVVLDALPVTPNGKTDRAALPAPDATNTLCDKAVVAPETPTEERLASIVATLLNVEQVSVDDNFFMLGGHSLLGTQLIARVTEIFGVDLTLRILFESPTVRQLSAEIEQLILARLEALSDEEVRELLSRP